MQLAGIAGTCPPPVPAPAAVAVFAGDHGVRGRGRDAVAAGGHRPDGGQLLRRRRGDQRAGPPGRGAGAGGRRRRGIGARAAARTRPPQGRGRDTADLATGPAMTVAQATAALDVGAEVAAELVARRCRRARHRRHGDRQHHPVGRADRRLHRAGRPPRSPGAAPGSTTRTLARRSASSSGRWRSTAAPSPPGPSPRSPPLGGLEIAALAGFVVGGAAARVPVVVDGVIAVAALARGRARWPRTSLACCVAGHRSQRARRRRRPRPPRR